MVQISVRCCWRVGWVEVAPYLIQDVVAPLALLEVDEPRLFKQEVLGPRADKPEVAIILQLDVLACLNQCWGSRKTNILIAQLSVRS